MLLGLIVFLVLVVVLFSLPVVQTYLATIITNEINKTYKTNILIDKVDFSYLGKIQLKGIHINDYRHNKMIDVAKLSTSIFSYKMAYNNKLNFDNIKVSNVYLNMVTYKGETNDNLSIFIEKFDDQPSTTGQPSSFLMTAKNIHLEQGNFYLSDFNFDDKPLAYYKQLNGDLKRFKIKGPNVSVNIRNLTFIEDHGLEVKKLDTDFEYTLTGMQFHNSELKTETSSLNFDLNFDYDRNNLKYFYDSVQVKASIKKSLLSMPDLKHFYNEIDGNQQLTIYAQMKGTLNDFELNQVDLKSSTKVYFKGKMRLINSFKVKAPFKLETDIESLAANAHKLKQLLPNLIGKNLPDATNVLGDFLVIGKTDITKNTINTQSQIKSALGKITLNMDFGAIADLEQTNYKGILALENFKLGKVIKDTLVGYLSLIASIDGRGMTFKSLNTSVKANISKHQYKAYTYNKIDLDGVFKYKKFTGKLVSIDDNLKLAIQGEADFSQKQYRYDFNTNIDFVNFNALNLYTKDKISLFKGAIDINLVGSSIDALTGSVAFNNTTYTNQTGIYFFKNFKIASSIENQIKTIEINSPDIVSGKLMGNFKLLELPNLFKNGLGSILSKYQFKKTSDNQTVSYNFKIYNKALEIFYPDFKLATNTIIRGNLASIDTSFTLIFKTPQLDAFKNSIQNINLQIDNKNPLFSTLLNVDKITSDYYDISKLNLVNVKLKDTLFLRTDFYGGDSLTEKYNLSLYNTTNEKGNSVFGVKKSNVNVKNMNWILNPTNNKDNKIIFDDSFTVFDIKKIDLQAGAQKINIDGYMLDKNNSDFQLNLENVDIENITPKIDSLALKGRVNGNLNWKKTNGQLMPIADMTIDNFSINNSYQGNAVINAQGFNSLKKYELNALINRNDIRTLYVKGSIDFENENPTIDVDITFKSFMLNAFSALGENVLSNIRGNVNGQAKISGELKNPTIDGELTLVDAGLNFPYINVDYHFDGAPKVRLHNHTFEFENATISDSKFNTKAFLSGTISHDRFKKWFLDLKLATKNLLVLNTVEDEETLYYGTGFIEGKATISGLTDNLLIQVNGKTNPGTKFIIPLSDVRTIDESNLIHFVKKEVNPNKIKSQEDYILDQLQGLNIKFNIDVTKDAIAQIVIDKKTGTILKGSGDGNLQININTNGNFTMFGNFVVDNGIYEFKNIINKSFNVKKGGTISWTGNPYNANLDIEAVYHTKANPGVLLENAKGTRNIDVDLITKIKGKLFESNMEFDVFLPTASSTVNSELQFKLNNSDKKMTQFFSLLTTGSFFSQDSNNFDSNAVITGTISDRISSVLSDILNKEGNKFQVGFIYDIGSYDRLSNLKTEDQLGITVSSKISKKFTVNGKVGVPVGSKSQSSVIGEVEITTPLNKSESLTGRIFNRQNQIQFAVADQEGYTQGVGISYRVDFDNLKDLFKKTKPIKKSNQAKKDSIQAALKLIKFKPVKKDSLPNKKH